ncbi:transcriptional regulator with XRE-family HTH domain [Streptomyces sp. DSM 41037]|uniref:helix-turn-helix domain-containing protein n=1 Tax=Streptomyces sp. DSM 41037 TaxID=2817710 RepID=UPI002786402C|nr:helix-turn-helix transcriptional regulator [Streptomyces sp. DSM 41037]MDQ0293900.1 transcriptional regulator with XRE-family HTH domain [Streptomyces sp. DSM 41037]
MPARKSTGTADAKQVLVKELQRLREASGFSYRELAELTNYDASYLQRLHTGESNGSPEALAALDNVYSTGHLRGLWELSKSAGFTKYFRKFATLEAQAISRADYHASLIPGILQTAAYARELLRTHPHRSDEEAEAMVELRMERQANLFGAEAIIARIVIDELALLRPLGDSAAWADQLDHLMDCAQRPNLTLQILPSNAGAHYLVGGGVSLLWLPAGKCVAQMEGTSTGQLVDDPLDIEVTRLGYDQIRDRSLFPVESLNVLKKLREGTPRCNEV